MTSSNSSSVKSSSISFRISCKKRDRDSYESNWKVFYPKFFNTDKAGTNIIKNPEMLKFKFSKWYCHQVWEVSTWKRLLIHPRWALPDLEGRPGTLSPLLQMYQVIILQYLMIFSFIVTIRILSTDFRNLLSRHRVRLTWRCFELKYREWIPLESLGNFNETFSMFARGLVKGN